MKTTITAATSKTLTSTLFRSFRPFLHLTIAYKQNKYPLFIWLLTVFFLLLLCCILLSMFTLRCRLHAVVGVRCCSRLSAKVSLGLTAPNTEKWKLQHIYGGMAHATTTREKKYHFNCYFEAETMHLKWMELKLIFDEFHEMPTTGDHHYHFKFLSRK